MATVSVRNLGIIQSKNPDVAQALRDLITYISSLQTQISTLQSQVQALQAK